MEVPVTSHLGRLFTFAKATEHAALENFMTEALAAAIRSDPKPFTLALATLGFEEPPGFNVVLTQVPIERGILDLLLRAAARTFVVEIKIGSPESGDAIDRYLGWIKNEPVGSALIVLLGPTRLRDDVP